MKTSFDFERKHMFSENNSIDYDGNIVGKNE